MNSTCAARRRASTPACTEWSKCSASVSLERHTCARCAVKWTETKKGRRDHRSRQLLQTSTPSRTP
eukprot:6454180-Pyramimonas_sp.AAC.1